ncbi:MAG TPA: universal stress protein [Oculatellaceae cyanobacterium]
MTQSSLKILLPIDIASLHPEVFEVLKTLVPLKSAQATLLFVREELPAYETMLGTMADFPTDLPHQIEKKAEEVLAAQADILRNDCGTVNTKIVLGPPAMTIETVAEHLDCDLIAMAPGEHSKVSQFLIGSTCERVSKHAKSSVLIVRSNKAAALKNVVVGIDGSEKALKAMLKAAATFSLAAQEVTVTLVNVVSVTGIFKYISPPGFVARVEDNLMMSGEAALAQAEKSLIEAGVKKVVVKLRNGEPEAELLAAAKEVSAELIILGAQGRSALEEAILGSVSSKVAAHATVSTAVFR